MDWQAIGASAEVLGAILVFASLIFLAIQVRRYTNESRRNSMEDATSHRSDFVRLIATDHELAGIVGSGLTGTGLTPNQWFQFNLFLYAIFVEFEFNERKSRSGDMDKDLWDAWVEAYRWWLQFPGVRKWWASRPAGFTSQFREFIDTELTQQDMVPRSVLAQFAKIRAEPVVQKT